MQGGGKNAGINADSATWWRLVAIVLWLGTIVGLRAAGIQEIYSFESGPFPVGTPLECADGAFYERPVPEGAAVQVLCFALQRMGI
jgi:hypothetical protein